MARQPQIIPVDLPFIGGLDEKVAERLMPPESPRLRELQNFKPVRAGKLEREKGLTALSSNYDVAGSPAGISNVRSIFSHKEQLVAKGPSNLYAYSANEDKWVSVPGRFQNGNIKYEELGMQDDPTDQETAQYTGLAEHSGLLFILHGEVYHVYDQESQTFLIHGGATGFTPTGIAGARICATRDYIYMAGPIAGNQARLLSLDPSNPTVGPVTRVSVNIEPNSPSTVKALDPGNSNYVAFVYQVPVAGTNGRIRTNLCDTSGSISTCDSDINLAASVAALNAVVVRNAANTGDDRWVMPLYVENTRRFLLFYVAFYDESASTVATSAAQTSIYDYGAINKAGKTVVGLKSKGTGQGDEAWVYFEYPYTPAYTSTRVGVGYILRARIQSDGSIPRAAAIKCRSGHIASEPFYLYPTAPSIFYRFFKSVTTGTGLFAQSHYGILRDGETSIARFAVDKASNGATLLTGSRLAAFSEVITSGSYSYRTAIAKTVLPIASTAIQYQSGSSVISGFVYSSALVTADENSDANEATLGDATLIGGWLPHLYDGAQVYEYGFPHGPWIVDLVGEDNANGAIGNGDVGVAAVYEWYDAQGNRYQSIPGPTNVLTMAGDGGGSTSEFDVEVPYLHLTEKTDVKIRIYRTEVDGSNLYSESVHDNNPSGTFLTTTVGHVSDAAISVNEQLYTNASALAHISPSAPFYVATLGDRFVAVTRHNEFWISKLYQESRGTQFAVELKRFKPDRASDIQAVQEFNGQLIVITEDYLMRQYGDGPNNLGVGAWSRLEPFEYATGGLFQTPVVVWAGGLMFQGPRGLWNLGRDLSVKFIGESIQDSLGSGVVKDLVLKADEHCVLAVVKDSLSHYKYHYQYDVWEEHLLPAGPAFKAAAIFDSAFVFYGVAAGGSSSYFGKQDTDFSNSTGGIVETEWLRPGNVPGFHRTTWIYLLGEYIAAHTLVVTITYEDGTTEAKTFAVNSSVKPYILRVKPGRQKASAFRVKAAITSGANAAVYLNGVGLDIAVKRKYTAAPSLSK